MRRQDFFYQLPKELIANYPLPRRSESRLMCLDEGGALEHRQFSDLLSLLLPGDVLVFNNTKVIPARLFAKKISGGKVEILIERITGQFHALAHIKASKSPKAGAEIYLEDGSRLFVGQRAGANQALFELDFVEQPVMEVLDKLGSMPLPPYIDREQEGSDLERYQTTYASEPGAVAAPTAGLHFDDAMIEGLKSKGVNIVFVTLHIGAGTFQPVRAEKIADHVMHSEWFSLDECACHVINQAKACGRRVVAVGTTSVRCLESAALSAGQDGRVCVCQEDTNIFITPGFKFQIVDALITNFHLPESTLLMLVSAFAGYSETMAAYQQAVECQYRFFSYGDAMLITR